MSSIYEEGLDKNAANFVALSPVSFVERSAEVFADLPAVIHGRRRYTWAQVRERSARLAAALAAMDIGRGDTVSAMLANTPEMIEAHYAVPALNAVLNTLNTRLDAPLLAWQMNHCEASVLITDREFAPVIGPALALLKERHGRTPIVIDVDDSEYAGPGDRLGSHEYEALLAAHEPLARLAGPVDEWDAIAVSYTSGTTGDPKGVVTHHRGAYLNAVCNAATWTMPHFPKYLWTLPMFHCNGWCFPWTVAMLGGTHVCLRKVDPALIFPMIERHKVTHLCGAPVVLNMLVHAPDALKRRFDHVVEVATGGAAPPSAVIEAMERMGFRVTHLYGLTESYGPATLCAWQQDWDGLALEPRAHLMARQGVRYPTLEDLQVADPETHRVVPPDGETLGEVMLRGNTIMKGYLRNPGATREAFREGWYHTGDLAVRHPDGYIEVKDRSKDIIISGGENISSLDVEECLYRHPKIMEAAVVARPDAKWGETPCAFVVPKPGASLEAADVVGWCKQHLARYKVPRTVVFGELPKTSTGKIQKFVLRDRARSL